MRVRRWRIAEGAVGFTHRAFSVLVEDGRALGTLVRGHFDVQERHV